MDEDPVEADRVEQPAASAAQPSIVYASRGWSEAP